ncbi:MAG: ABC transporter substrate-binding protein [Rhizobiaceae bacterium]|nr:ABC transporter substrate-binding protein [Rhizobiaceae bacterium]
MMARLISRRQLIRATGGTAFAFAAAGVLGSARAQGKKAKSIVVGRQPVSGSSVAITRYMIDNKVFEEEALKFGYELTIDWRNFPNAGPIMELLKAGPDSMTFAFVGNTPVVTAIANNLPLQVVTTGEGTQPFFMLVRPGSEIRNVADLQGKTIGTLVGLDPQNAFIQALAGELGKTPEDLGIRFQNFPEFPVLARLPRGIDAAGMVPWSPSYSAIDAGHAVVLFDTRGTTGPAYAGGAGQRLSGVGQSPFRPEGFYQFRPFWITHSEVMQNDPDLVLAWIIAYQRSLTAIREQGAEKVAVANQEEWRQPPNIGVDIISADLLWNRGWVWICEGDMLSVVAASGPLAAAGNISRAITWDVMKEHLAAIAPLQKRAWEVAGQPVQSAFEKPDSELTDLRGLPVWESEKWGRYADRV